MGLSTHVDGNHGDPTSQTLNWTRRTGVTEKKRVRVGVRVNVRARG